MTLASIETEAASAPQRAAATAAIRIWLLVIAVMIVAMVLVGGATRLTDSGLSITEWKPIHGVIPPLDEAEWQEEFEKYKKTPEYVQINKGMSLDAFKTIFWWEWGHRLLGRAIGVVFAVPLAIFWLAGMLPGWLKPRLLVLLGLGGLQGFVGWWMVTSGLIERTDVSQYRLAIHLTFAFVILAYTAWLFAALTPRLAAAAPGAERLRGLAAALLAAVVFQVFLGGLVAGLDAGLTFNTWPLMDGAVVPDGLWIVEPAWLNHFENVATVQFQHRVTAYALIALAGIAAWRALAAKAGRAVCGTAVALAVLMLVQAAIGIATLVLSVPLSWALVHQGVAALVLIAAVVHLRAVTPSAAD